MRNTKLTKLDSNTIKKHQVQLDDDTHFTVEYGDHNVWSLPTVGWYCVFSISSEGAIVQYAVSYTSDARAVRSGMNASSMRAWHAF